MSKIFLDSTTFCYINDCSWFIVISNFATNWAEIVFGFNMIWTTVVSAAFTDYRLETDYKFYFSIGDNMALMFDDLIGYKPTGAY